MRPEWIEHGSIDGQEAFGQLKVSQPISTALQEARVAYPEASASGPDFPS